MMVPILVRQSDVVSITPGGSLSFFLLRPRRGLVPISIAGQTGVPFAGLEPLSPLVRNERTNN